MFEYLMSTIFPLIGQFFENLIAFSSLRPIALLDAIYTTLEYPNATPISLFLETVNYWTGMNGIDNIYFYGIEFSFAFMHTVWGRAIGVAVYPVLSFFFAPALNAPMWLALPICFTFYGLLLSALKWLISIILGRG